MTRFHADPLIDDAIQTVWRTHPYYASAVTKLRIVADASVATMATSEHWVTHYNPSALAAWSPDERAAVLVHELEHLLRRHHDRCGDRDPQRFNVAADAEINQRLSGLPDGAVYPETLGMPRGRNAEVYYAVAGDDGENAVSCGSSAGGPTQAHETGDAANPGAGAANGGADARREAAQEIIDSGIGAGDEQGNELRDWAETELGMDRAAWYTALSSAIGHTLSPVGVTRWRWPGHRDMRDLGGAMLPRWVGERPSCAVIIDTSSSITTSDLDMARAAGHYLGRMADTTYWGCDTVPTRYGPTMPDRIVGGGGTDLTKGIDAAIADGAKAIVIITDCMTRWPAEPTRVPIIIAANPKATAYVLGGDARWGVYMPPDWMTIIPLINP